MSFILDALKKSENARQRQIGPAVAELPRRRRQGERPIWAFVVAGLLLVNIGVLALVLTRKKEGNAQPVAAAAAAPTPAPPTVQQQLPVQSPAVLPAPQIAPQPVAPLPAPPPVNTTNAGMVSSLEQESGIRADFDVSVSESDRQMLQAIERAQEQIAQEDQRTAAARPIQAPAVAPLSGVTAAQPATGRVIGGGGRSTGSPGAAPEILPTVNELAASGRTFPPMRLDIHSFADNPAERFIFINMRRYNEGQTLQEGPSVERITPDGVVLNQQGLRFVLPRP